MFLPSEWHEQEFVQLTWPHEQTDWAPILTEATQCFLSMAAEISKREKLVILAQNPYEVSKQIETCTLFTQAARQRITILSCLNNDTWARDHAFISCLHHDGSKTTRHLLDYQFNGWGMKFPSNFDNQLNRNLYQSLNQEDNIYINNLDFVLEGGSVESDGKGTILTTSSCLLAPNRNDTYTRSQIEERLLRDFHAKQVLWLDYGHLEGDDTDGHIDTLARFCPNDTIAYVRCNDKSDSHYQDLSLMEQQLQSFRTQTGQPFQLVPLPMAPPLYDENLDGTVTRLPSTYANFLIINQAVLFPTYGNHQSDTLAAHALQQCFPKREIVGIDCQVLVRQHGSLHCSAMQYPAIHEE